MDNIAFIEDLTNLEKGQAKYTVLLNYQGGIIDDIIFYYQGIDDQQTEKGVLIVNASTTAKDWAWLKQQLEDSAIELQDYSRDLALIALQGQNAIDFLNPLVTENLTDLSSFNHLTCQIEGEEVFIARTGYTGEDGFEIMTTPVMATKLWQDCQNKDVTPCGLGARDTLRLEAGMCLYGQDMNDETTPLEAGLNWLVDLDHDFIGKEKLLFQKQEGIGQ